MFLKQGESNAYRYQFIREAYRKIQSTGTGLVKLDDIAKNLDVSKHPEVVDGGKQ